MPHDQGTPGAGSGRTDAAVHPLDAALRPLWRQVRAWLPPDWIVRLRHRRQFGAWPDLRAPRTFNEKLMRRMLRDRDPRLVAWTDKVEAKRLVADLVSPDLVVPTLWAGDDPDAAPLESLECPYVCKAAHGCDMNLFVYGPDDVRPDAIRAAMRRWLATDFADTFMELQYRRIPRRVLVERMLRGEDGSLVDEWKLFVFGGTVRMVGVNRYVGGIKYRAMLDRDWNRLDLVFHAPDMPDAGPPPPELPEMIRVAERIGTGFGFVRVDLYLAEGKLWFSEATFTPGAGAIHFERPEWDLRLGEMWPAEPGLD